MAGIGAPKGTPDGIIEMLNREIGAVLLAPNMKAKFNDLGYYTPFAGTPSEVAKFVANDVEKLAKVIRAANIKRE
jgi:tripartite-type tricarboxylate transporter receptor subunit TctC